MSLSPTIVVARGRFGSTAGRVLEQVRGQGLASREMIARGTGLSTATVARTVGLLTDVGLLRERPELAVAGAVGRPGIPVEIDTRRYVVLGAHVGRRVVTAAVGDVAGRVLASRTRPRAAGAVDVESLGAQLAEVLGSVDAGEPLAAAVVAPWQTLGLDAAGTAAALTDVLGLDVAHGDHIAAIAATEFLHRRHGTPGVTAYVYARDTAGFAVAIDRGGAEPDGRVEMSRVSRLTHFPTGSQTRCGCGAVGCLEATASDLSLATRAFEQGVTAEPSIHALYAAAAAAGSDDAPARRLVVERAEALGRAAAAVRDMVGPDRVVLVGQAFTGYRPVLERIVHTFRTTGEARDVEVSFTRFGDEIQSVAPCTVALGPVYDDPIAVLPERVQRLHTNRKAVVR